MVDNSYVYISLVLMAEAGYLTDSFLSLEKRVNQLTCIASNEYGPHAILTNQRCFAQNT